MTTMRRLSSHLPMRSYSQVNMKNVGMYGRKVFFYDDISNLSYLQFHTQLLFESQSNQALETFKKLSTNNCFVEVEIVAHDEEEMKRKRIETLVK